MKDQLRTRCLCSCLDGMRIGGRQSLKAHSISFIRPTNTARDNASKLRGTPGLMLSYVLTFLSALSDATRFSEESRWGLHRHRLKSESWKEEECSCGTLLTSAGYLWRQPSLPWYVYNLHHVHKKEVYLYFLLLLVWAQLPRDEPSPC